MGRDCRSAWARPGAEADRLLDGWRRGRVAAPDLRIASPGLGEERGNGEYCNQYHSLSVLASTAID
jgi:hypothetical protein